MVVISPRLTPTDRIGMRHRTFDMCDDRLPTGKPFLRPRPPRYNDASWATKEGG
jgi:hypothetical protein